MKDRNFIRNVGYLTLNFKANRIIFDYRNGFAALVVLMNNKVKIIVYFSSIEMEKRYLLNRQK